MCKPVYRLGAVPFGFLIVTMSYRLTVFLDFDTRTPSFRTVIIQELTP